MAAAGAGSLEVVVFPWLAFGHMIPYLELSKRLAARGHAVAFVSTPRNLARLPPVPADLSSSIRFVPLPLPRVDGMPEGAESTADVPPEKMELLKKAMDGLAGPFDTFLAEAVAGGRKPDWIIQDFCHHWLPPIADEHKVPCDAFVIVQAAFIFFLGPRWAHPRTALEDFTVSPKWIPFPSTIAYRRHEAEWIAGAFQVNASGVSDMDRTWKIFEGCRLTIYRSCDEVEPRMFALLTDLLRKPAIPAGILPPPDIADDGRGDDESSSGVVRPEVLRRLDNQPRARAGARRRELPVGSTQAGRHVQHRQRCRRQRAVAGRVRGADAGARRGADRVGAAGEGARTLRGGRVPDALRVGLHHQKLHVGSSAGDAPVRRRPVPQRAGDDGEGDRRGGGEGQGRRLVQQGRRRGGGVARHGGGRREGVRKQRQGAKGSSSRSAPAGAVHRRPRGPPAALQGWRMFRAFT